MKDLKVGDRVYIDFDAMCFNIANHYVIGHVDGEPFTVSYVSQAYFRTKEIRGLRYGGSSICKESYHWLFRKSLAIDHDGSSDIQVDACADMFL